jgi:hypothetical protein
VKVNGVVPELSNVMGVPSAIIAVVSVLLTTHAGGFGTYKLNVLLAVDAILAGLIARTVIDP